jgi:hypothetical protein
VAPGKSGKMRREHDDYMSIFWWLASNNPYIVIIVSTCMKKLKITWGIGRIGNNCRNLEGI